MTIKRKVERTQIEQVIEKGGRVAADIQKQSLWTNFTLRIKTEMLNDISQALETTVGLSKTGFILQAIQEKLKGKNE